MRPASADAHRTPLKITSHTSPPLSKTTVDIHKDDSDKKGFMEPIRTLTLAQLKQEHSDRSRTPTGKDHLHRLYSDHSKLRLSIGQDTVQVTDRVSKYKEENRQILRESIEVAPFTAKIQRSTEPGLDRDRDHSRDPGFHSRISALASPNHKPVHAHQHVIQEKSNYFTTLSNSVVNEPPRLYPSKDSAFYEKVSIGASAIVASVGATVPNSGVLSLGNYNAKGSLSKPPPLIKHQPEGAEGLAGKITEQLSQQVALVQPHHLLHTGLDRVERHSPVISPLSSTTSQIRAMPSLHRAPVFHPPTQHSLERKEAERVAYGGRLSPPTLTPIQPVSLPSAGSKGSVEQQKPPTLLPELRDLKAHGVVTHNSLMGRAEVSPVDAWRNRDIIQEKGGARSKPQAATASVIVRSSTSIKYDGSFGANKCGALTPKESPQGRFYPAKPQGESLRPGDGAKDTGLSRVIQANSNMCDSGAQYKKVNDSVGLKGTASVCRTAASVPQDSEYSLSPRVGINSHGLAHSGENHEVVSTSSPGRSTAGTPQPSPCGSVSGGSPLYSSSFVHLKKHKAAWAAAQSWTSVSSSDVVDKMSTQPSPPPARLGQPSPSFDSSSNSSTSGSTTPNKSSPIPNGQPSTSATCSLQSNNYHKLKKAWLTRHSEEDRTSSPSAPPAVKAEKTALSISCSTATTNSTAAMSDMIKPCTVNLSASTSSEVDMSKDSGSKAQSEDKTEERKTPSSRRGTKRPYESGSESGADDSDTSESKIEGRAKRQPKPTYKKKQNDMAKRRGDDKDDEDIKPNGIFRSAREKTKLKLASSNGIPRSVLKDWRKVKKLKQTGESFLQDDSCSEIGPNLQKCRECRVIRSKKGEEPVHSPVFCRFYYFRRLSFSKNGVIRMDGFSSPEQFDDEALSLWAPKPADDSHLNQNIAKYILSFIGDKFCQMVTTENTAVSWIKKDAKLAWKRAVRGVREMCDACEATLFNIHWVCQKCGFVVCLDCFKAKEKKSVRDKELYTWLKCVKGQPHDNKHLMPTQIIPGTVLTELVASMQTVKEKHHIKAHSLSAAGKQNLLNKLPNTNGVSQVLQNVLNHSNKLSVVKAEGTVTQQKTDQIGTKPETNGGGSSPASDAGSGLNTPPESQSPLHFLANLAEQKSKEEKKENKESPLGKSAKEEKEGDPLEMLQHCKGGSLVANSTEQGSTLRDLLTTTAGKLKLGSTDAGIAFAPVYSTASQTGKGGRTMPNILDDIIASVVENKIPATRQNLTSKLSLKQETGIITNNSSPIPPTADDIKIEKKKLVTPADDVTNQYPDIPHCWLNNKRLLWLKDHRNQSNCKLFRENWRQGQPVLVSGIHKRLNASLWKADSFNQEFADHQGDLLNCKDQVVSNSGIKEFWDGFEDITKRPKSKDGDPMVYRLKDWPSGEEFMALMPSRYDDLMKNLPLPEYSDPEGSLNLASHLPSFFVRPDLGPRLCCAYGVAASQDQDFGTANLHIEVSDVVSVLVYVGVAKGNGVLSKTGVLKRLEEEDLDEGVRRRLKDSSETPGALWHIYLNRDLDKVREFLHKLCKEQGLDISLDQDPLREHGWYLSRKQRQRLQEQHGVQSWTVVQFLGDSVIIPAGAMHQVQNLHSCIQVINDFVSPEHVANSFQLTQELRPTKEEVNYEDKLQVKNILYHCVKEAVSALRRNSAEDETEKSA